MRVNGLIVVAVALLGGAPVAADPGQASGRGQSQARTPAEVPPQLTPAQRELVDLERRWDFAFEHRDTTFIANVLADEFIATYSDGSHGDKAQEVRLASEFNQQVDSSSMEDFVVKVYGDTAVVWFTKRMTGPKQGRPTTVAFSYTDVFVRRAGRWQCVSSQSSRIPNP
jgi:ketosteroid isomerase-like protein